jgi:hypothetical protein
MRGRLADVEGTGEFGERMNSMPKYVSSTEQADWTGANHRQGRAAAEIGSSRICPADLLSSSGQLLNGPARRT